MIEKTKRKNFERFRARFMLDGKLFFSEWFPERQSAETWEARIRVEHDEGRLILTRDMTLKTFSVEWIQHQQSTTVRSAWTNERGNLNNYIIPSFGDSKLRSIDLFTVQRWIDGLKNERMVDGKTIAGLSVNKRNTLIRCFKQVMYDAASWKKIPCSPIEGLEPLKIMKKEVEIYSHDELSKLFDWLFAHRPDELDLAMFAVNTGIRLGELFGIGWEDIDFDARTVRIQKMFDNREGRVVPRVKGKKSRRVPLNPACIEILARFKLEGRDKESEKVFGRSNYRRVTDDFVDWMKLAKLDAAVARGCTFHNFRHTFGSDFMRRKAGTIYELQQIMGHASYKTTEDNYLRFMPQDIIGKTDGVGFSFLRQEAKVIVLK